MTKYVKVSITTQYNIIRGVKPYRDNLLRFVLVGNHWKLYFDHHNFPLSFSYEVEVSNLFPFLVAIIYDITCPAYHRCAGTVFWHDIYVWILV